MKEELSEERSSRAVLINKKNAEISYFKTELDGLLAEIANTSAGSRTPKSDNFHLMSDLKVDDYTV